MGSFKGKVVLITGSSAGIGAVTAVHFAALGARLSLTGRDEGKLNSVAQRCIEAGLQQDDVLTSVGELTEETFRSQLVTKTVDKFGQLDVLVNNAGAASSGWQEDQSMDDFKGLFNINVFAHVSMSKLALSHLQRSKGNIVNISTNCGMCTIPGLGAYCMSKAALDMFTQVLSVEISPKCVRVNSVSPGCVVSEIHRKLKMTEEQFEHFLADQAKLHVARAVAFLASEESSFITGELLVVDGAGRYGGNDFMQKP